MGRRDMEVGDAVAVNDNGCKGIGFVVASSDDPEKTGGVGAAGRTAYLIRWVLGKNLQHGTTMGARGESWLNDDPKRIRIDGVQGYTMPKRFMGRNVARLCKGDNEFIGLPAPHDASMRMPMVRLAAVSVVCVLSIVLSLVFVRNREQTRLPMQQSVSAESSIDGGDAGIPGSGADNPYYYDESSGWTQEDSNEGSAQSDTNTADSADDSGATAGNSGFDPDNIRGTWCRSDGVTCVKITPQTEGNTSPLVLYTSRMGDLNPLPNGQTTIPLGYVHQDNPNTSSGAQQLITQYTYRIDCEVWAQYYNNVACDGEAVHTVDMSLPDVPRSGIKFVQRPLSVTRVISTSDSPIEGLDDSNPPTRAVYLVVEPYGGRAADSVSDDTVFYWRSY